MTDTRKPGVDARWPSLRPRRVSVLLALLAILALAAWIPSTASAESCVTQELLDVAGYSFADTPVLVNGREYSVRGVSRLVGLRSHAESRVLVDEAIRQYFGIGPSDPLSDRVILDALGRRLPEEAIDELLQIIIARLPVESSAREVARYTVCAEDGQPITAEQQDQALYTAAVRHRFLPEVANADGVVLAARNYVEQAGGVRISELAAVTVPDSRADAPRGVLAIATFAVLPGELFIAIINDDNLPQVVNRLENTPDDPRRTYGNSNRLLQALVNAEIGRGEYELWAADREVFRVLNAALTTAKLAVLASAVVGSGGTLTPLLAAEIGGTLASGGLQAFEWLTEQPEELVMRTASAFLDPAFQSELRPNERKQWQLTERRVAAGSQRLTHDQAEAYMNWRHQIIRLSSASETIEAGAQSWDEWVRLGLGLASFAGQYGDISRLVATGADASNAWIGFWGTVSDNYAPLHDLNKSMADEIRQNDKELAAFRMNLGLDQETDEPDCTPITLGTLVSRFEFEKPDRSATLSDGTGLCDEWSDSDPAFPGMTLYAQRFTFYVPVQTRVTISLESRYDVTASLVRLGHGNELLDSATATWRDDSEIVEINQDLSSGWYVMYLSSFSRLIVSEFRLSIAGGQRSSPHAPRRSDTRRNRAGQARSLGWARWTVSRRNQRAADGRSGQRLSIRPLAGRSVRHQQADQHQDAGRPDGASSVRANRRAPRR